MTGISHFGRGRRRLPAIFAATAALSVLAACQADPGRGVSPTATAPSPSQGPALVGQVPYQWKNVQIVGGGFVDGIIFHPTEPGVRYARTDMGGAYRWDGAARRWVPLLDWVSYADTNLMGVESIALDARNPDRVYLALGTYTSPDAPNGAILRSDDRGRTFRRVDVPIKFGGNENGRGNGERLAVDPNDPDTLYLGTRHDGLWVSHDGATTWSRVPSFPDVTEDPSTQAVAGVPPWARGGAGLVFVIFDPRSGAGAGKGSRTIYVGASLKGRDNLFRSTDGGKTWAPVPGQPTANRPTRAALAADGTLYVSYGSSPGPTRMTDGAVWKLDTRRGQWTDITPDKPDAAHGAAFGYAAVAVDAHNPRVVIASSFDRHRRPGTSPGLGEDIFRSVDGGKTWHGVFGGPRGDGKNGGVYDYSLAPYVKPTPIHWLFDIEIDPTNPDHALFTTGYGGWETFDLRAVDKGQPSHWQVMSTGIEETVAMAFTSPSQGAPLISAIGDYGGFVHWDLDKPAAEGAAAPPLFGNTDSVVSAPLKPEVVVRVGIRDERYPGANIGYSLDGGHSWQAAGMPTPEAKRGKVAVSADGATWVWTPQGAKEGLVSGAFVTTDRGATWTNAQGLPEGVRVIGDAVDPDTFYALSLFDGKLYVSTDRAAHFQARPFTLPNGLPTPAVVRNGRGDPRGGQDALYATPDARGDLWIAAFDGLYHGTAAGGAYTRMPGVEQLHAFGFGRAAPGAAAPALYLVGTIDRQRGIFRSDDAGRHWVRVNDDQHQWGLILQVSGDPKRYGRVYVGTHGRGIVYGDPS
ncbi:exo-alpha-sialidase [Nitrospirillum sp. BR 11828]|uniref:exo-alpha-sialidase n=1 Tax=Nitrospirillum sp. BR 11828 TaxID=3104325 RepID=UPI002ACA06D6|nr:exo-alpha-sialidase [Nitrospirillum sp. BR 11828]MDZ5645963.1 exo-alpha-sialidase [Nitrospirillum sp. BR 11828]